MNELMKNLAALLKVKTIVTLIVCGVWAFLSIKNNADVKDIVLMVIAFYFGTQAEKRGTE